MDKKVKKGKTSTTTKKSQPKTKIVKKENKCCIEFNTFSLLFQSLAIIIAVAAVVLSAIGSIDLELLLDLFCASVICLAVSLFPKKGH